MKIKKLIAAISAVAISAISLTAFGSLSASAEKKDSYNFWLAGQFNSSTVFWDANALGNPAVSVTADGTEYTVSLKNTSAVETKDGDLCLVLQSNVNVQDYKTADGKNALDDGSINVQIVSVKVDGTAVNYTRDADGNKSLITADNGNDLRLNIYNTWQKKDGSDYPSKDINPELKVSSGIEVTFKTVGLFAQNSTEDTNDTNTNSTAETTASTEAADADEATTTVATTQAVVTTSSVATTPTSSSNGNNTSSNPKLGGSSDPSSSPANGTAVDTDTNAATGDSSHAVAVAMLAIVSCGAVVASRKRK